MYAWFGFQDLFQGLETMEDEDLEIDKMIKKHTKAGGIVVGEGETDFLLLLK